MRRLRLRGATGVPWGVERGPGRAVVHRPRPGPQEGAQAAREPLPLRASPSRRRRGPSLEGGPPSPSSDPPLRPSLPPSRVPGLPRPVRAVGRRTHSGRGIEPGAGPRRPGWRSRALRPGRAPSERRGLRAFFDAVRLALGRIKRQAWRPDCKFSSGPGGAVYRRKWGRPRHTCHPAERLSCRRHGPRGVLVVWALWAAARSLVTGCHRLGSRACGATAQPAETEAVRRARATHALVLQDLHRPAGGAGGRHGTRRRPVIHRSRRRTRTRTRWER